MFAKPATFKPFAAIKNSERKNLVAAIESQNACFELETEDKLRLVPKGIQSAKCVSHAGDKVVVYSDAQCPLWVSYKSTFVPTVGLMATLPSDLQNKLLPTIYTPSQTLRFLKNGADFMVPGIFGDLPKNTVKVGQAVQIRDYEHHRLMATGIALRDLSQIDLQKDSGKCVQTISVANDKLTPNVDFALLESLSVKDSVRDEPATSAPASTSTPLPAKPEKEGEINISISENAQNDEEVMPDLSTSEVDEAFLYALNKAVRQPNLEYPLSMSAISTLMNGFLPYEHPKLLIKNTSFKKMNKLLKFAEKQGLIATKDRQGGETIVVSTNAPTDPESINNIAKPQRKTAPKLEKMDAIVVYKPPPALRSILPPDQGDFVDAAYLRKALVAYVRSNALVSSDHVTISVDLALQKALGLKQTVETIQVTELAPLAIKKSSAFHRLTPLGHRAEDMPLEKGPIPTVEIKTERRGGNKVVTLVGVSGLKGFYIDPVEFADELRHACAGSSAITNAKGFEAIVVQGNHVLKISQLLEKRGIKQSWIKA